MIRKHFITGFALLLPVVFTLWVILFLVNVLTAPFLSVVEGALHHYQIFRDPFLFLSIEQISRIISKILIVITLVIFTTGIGMCAQIVAAHYFIRFGDYIIHQIPIINRIYKAAQDVVKSLFAEDRKTFSQVALVPFPNENSYSLGLITQDAKSLNPENAQENLVSIFIPATPNPTMGFLLMLPRDKVTYIDMKVDEALKAIISCGIMIPEISQPHTTERTIL